MKMDKFNEWAPNYDMDVQTIKQSHAFPFAGYDEVLSKIEKLLVIANCKRILDVGFGTGVLTKRLYDKGIEIYGIDFSTEMVNQAKEKMVNATLLVEDFSEGLPQEWLELKFDAIISTYAFHHLTLSQKRVWLMNALNYLNEDGMILIGDVMFDTEDSMNTCREQNLDDWDDQEYYIVKEWMNDLTVSMSFETVSFCAGVLKIQKL